MVTQLLQLNSENDEEASSSQRNLSEVLYGTDITKQRILAYQKKAPAAPEGYQNALRVVYTQSKTPSSVNHSSRYIPHAPDRILDAPDIIDDYCNAFLINHEYTFNNILILDLNLMDWSTTNLLACALGSQVYLWNAGTGNIEQLLELEGNDYICSLNWAQDGNYLAVGATNGTTELWDCGAMKRLRIMDGHSARVNIFFH